MQRNTSIFSMLDMNPLLQDKFIIQTDVKVSLTGNSIEEYNVEIFAREMIVKSPIVNASTFSDLPQWKRAKIWDVSALKRDLQESHCSHLSLEDDNKSDNTYGTLLRIWKSSQPEMNKLNGTMRPCMLELCQYLYFRPVFFPFHLFFDGNNGWLYRRLNDRACKFVLTLMLIPIGSNRTIYRETRSFKRARLLTAKLTMSPLSLHRWRVKLRLACHWSSQKD